MTATPAGAPVPGGDSSRTLTLSALLKRPITARDGESLGRLSDVIVRLRGADYPLVTGLGAAVGGRQVYVPVEQVSSLDAGELKLTSARLDLRRFERREGEVLLRADVLGHRLIDVARAHLVRAADLQLAERDGAWMLSGVDARRRPRGTRWLIAGGSQEPARRFFRDQSQFEVLIGHSGSAVLRGPFARIRGLKPAQIADLIEDASKAEESEILGRGLPGARPDQDVAEVLSRMRADDAADAIAELPQRRREPVLDLLPPGQRAKVLTLMGFSPTSAGGLMGMDYLALPASTEVADVLLEVRQAVSLQPEALTSVHAISEQGRLVGVARLVTLVQAASRAQLGDVSDHDPVRVGPDTDVVDVAVLMTDYILITIPVVDDRCQMLGVITVDDVLEVTLPEDWRRREAAEPPDAHRGEAQ